MAFNLLGGFMLQQRPFCVGSQSKAYSCCDLCAQGFENGGTINVFQGNYDVAGLELTLCEIQNISNKAELFSTGECLPSISESSEESFKTVHMCSDLVVSIHFRGEREFGFVEQFNLMDLVHIVSLFDRKGLEIYVFSGRNKDSIIRGSQGISEVKLEGIQKRDSSFGCEEGWGVFRPGAPRGFHRGALFSFYLLKTIP